MRSDLDHRDTPPRQLVLIFGPAAVGKMTVGQELAKLTGFTLLYNHQIVDLVTELFAFGTPMFHRLARSAKSGSRVGLGHRFRIRGNHPPDNSLGRFY